LVALLLDLQKGITMLEVQTEHVLVVPTALFHKLGHFQGFSSEADRYVTELLQPANVSFRPRSEMETDPSFKQLIPYVIFRHRDSSGRQMVFQYTRGKGQGEGRLRTKRSVGIGGHISADDAGESAQPYEEGLRRELAEEVNIGSPYTEQRVGLINDDESEVGRVHLGVVHIFDLEEPLVEPRESEILECGFREVQEILADLTGFETWSQICLRALFGPKD
jgi:predicted NUDIX family phosphoesterase